VKGKVAVGLLLVAACARIGEPPGGPPDSAAPLLVATVPDSLGIYPDFDDDAAFVFDETVSEGGAPNFGLGTGDLEKLVILSPSTEVPKVRWKRSRIVIKPREGWKPDRVYRIELLPGVMDLRNNRSKAGRVITFSTGAPLPRLTLRGRVVDWTTGRPEAQAVVEAVLAPDGDSLVYKATTDSTGRFEFGPLPDGEYLVAGVLDQNNNRKRDGRESFDTVRVAVGRDSVGEIWAFRHDTVAARIQTLTTSDSMSVTVQFNQHLSPYQRLPADSVTVLQLPDSTTVPVVAILPKDAYDSLYGARPPSPAGADSAAADSVAATPPDTAAAVTPVTQPPTAGAVDSTDRGPLKTKPLLFDRLMIRLDQPLEPGKRYRIEVRGVENVSGVFGDAAQGLAVERRVTPVDSTRADSTRADSTGARPDSTPPSTPPPPPRRP